MVVEIGGALVSGGDVACSAILRGKEAVEEVRHPCCLWNAAHGDGKKNRFIGEFRLNRCRRRILSPGVRILRLVKDRFDIMAKEAFRIVERTVMRALCVGDPAEGVGCSGIDVASLAVPNSPFQRLISIARVAAEAAGRFCSIRLVVEVGGRCSARRMATAAM